MFRLVLIAALVVLSGCGSFQPFATPNVPRPALPLGDPWPVPVEDVIERLQALGYQCNFEPDSDIPGGWRCDRGDGVSVSLDSDEAGPILSAWGYMFDESAPGKEVMDGRAVAVFRDELLAALLPDGVTPSDEALLTMVQKNWPVELEDGWILGFDRASTHRTLNIRYVQPDEGKLDEASAA